MLFISLYKMNTFGKKKLKSLFKKITTYSYIYVK